MKVFYISPTLYKTDRFFDTFTSTFISEGHQIVTDIKEADMVFFDLHCRYGSYDWMNLCYIIDHDLPLCVFDNWDYGAMAEYKWIGNNNWQGVMECVSTHDWANFLELVIKNNNKVFFFVRKMEKTEDYSYAKVFPIDWTMYPECDLPQVSKEELFNRPYDCCIIGTLSTARESLIDGILKDGRLKLKYESRDCTQRKLHTTWIDEHREAKMFIECCGGGMGSERPLQLFSVAPMLKNRNNQIYVNPFTDMVNCVEVDSSPSKKDIDKVIKTINDKDLLYEIYLNGINHIHTFYNEQWRAKYILETIKNQFN